jgi:hypothetical protein
VNAAEALRAAHAAGVTVALDGESLVLEAEIEPPQEVLDALSRHKLAILALLEPSREERSAKHWRGYFQTRRIAASRNGLPRAEADSLAFANCVIEWLNQHPAPSAPGRCASCGKQETEAAVVVAFGTEPATHAWLHAECWPAWHRERTADAVAVLRRMGIRA